MKNRCRWIALALLMALCLTPLQAQAGISDKKFQENFRKSVEKITNNFTTCSKGDKGDNVKKVKMRLKTLGYYSSSATYDDEFNDIMVKRVKLFQENNGLKVTGKVDSDTVTALKGSNPIRGEYYEDDWDEPAVTLIMPDVTYAKWDKRSDNKLGFSVELKNVSTTR